LTPDRLQGIASDVRSVASLPDPVGELIEERTLPNGLELSKRRVPLGVIGTIYESRPNVTVDISALCLKSGNAVILRGGKESAHSNSALAQLIRESIDSEGLPADVVQFVDSTDRRLVQQLLDMDEIIDLMIPRGGVELIRFVAEKARMPVITGGIGVCHTYVDSAADTDMSVSVVYNAKVQRPTVCNALDTLLVHVKAAPRILPLIAQTWAKAGVEMHCDNRALAILEPIPGLLLRPVEDEDWGKEFLSLVAAVKIVDSLDEAVEHIEIYGNGHSEAIITDDVDAASCFLQSVDASAVFVNASTYFNDGAQFGLGAEVAISTNKLHARGPMGLRELTTYKWIVRGNGHIRI
jgi:glutamate-5-semialdehyde dehydrogenase